MQKLKSPLYGHQLMLMQVGRKVAQVLESLGRSAESIQEAEVGMVITNHCWSCDHNHSGP